MLKRLKEKWGIVSNKQLIIIFVVFGITGSLSVKLALPVLQYLNINPDTFETIPLGNVIYWVLRILIIFPVYQVLLLGIGTIFFQFRFFWEFEKKIMNRLIGKQFFDENN
ncbi:MAG: DUF6787 family protein [Flavobacteriaceae bacterium]